MIGRNTSGHRATSCGASRYCALAHAALGHVVLAPVALDHVALSGLWQGALRTARLLVSSAIAICLVCMLTQLTGLPRFAACRASAAETDGDKAGTGALLHGVSSALAGTSVQLSSEYKDEEYIHAQQLDVRLALFGWSAHLDASFSTAKPSRVRLSAKRDMEKMQVDVGYLTESTPFGLVIPRSGVTGVRVRAKVDPPVTSFGSAGTFAGYRFIPQMGSPYARMYLLAGEARDQLFAGWWLYEPRCSVGLFAPAGHDEFLICSLHQLPAGYGSLQAAMSTGRKLTAARFAHLLKLKVNTALGTTSVEVGKVPPEFSKFVASLGDSYHGWSRLEVSHSRRYPLDLSISWSRELRDSAGYLARPQEHRTVTGISIGTPDYSRLDATVGLTNRDYLNITDGQGFERRGVLTASIDYLWDYKPCMASTSVEYREGESVSLPGYPGYRGWFEKDQRQLVANGSFDIYTYLGYFTFAARHLDTVTTRLDETNLRFTSWETLTDRLAVCWHCIPIEPWTAASFALELKDYARVIRSCTGGAPGASGAGELSYSLDGYRSIGGTISSAVQLPSEASTRTVSFSGTLELRRAHGTDCVTPVITGKVVYTVKL